MEYSRSDIQRYILLKIEEGELQDIVVDRFYGILADFNSSGIVMSQRVRLLLDECERTGRLADLVEALQLLDPLRFEIYFAENRPGQQGADGGAGTFRTFGDGKRMALVPAGPFLFGQPAVEETLPAYWIDQTPVTCAEYKRFLDANPTFPVPEHDAPWAEPFNWDRQTRRFPFGLENIPVVLVSWQDARAYAAWAGKRLPTEQEWEKAARGNDRREYPWGSWQPGRANTRELGAGRPTNVGRFSPNGDSPFEVREMCGNVWEWTATFYDGLDERVVLRGGSFLHEAGQAACWYRNWFVKNKVAHSIGFRCVVTAE